MKRITAIIVTLALLTVALSVGLAGTGSAQSVPENPVTNDTQDATETPESDGVVAYIDGQTRILNQSYNQEAGTVSLVIESDGPQRITVSDGGFLADGKSGHIPTQSVRGSGKHTITVSVTQVDGMIAVGITTQASNYGHVIEPKRTSIWERTNSRDGWLGGVSVTIAMGFVAAYRVKNNDPDSPEEPE
ncbi:hypothetical protein [Haloarcula montana]|uniref:hypothetical protein n=1 Tax=Haloarcula montana TaxID=3111776 RepID=UPI002D775ECF|nr:hypothetical protein [Haloarcula sp. GH36]